MKRLIKTVSLLTIVAFGAIATEAGVIKGRWDKVDKQSPGSALTVTYKTGQTTKGKLIGTTDDEITVATPSEVRIKKSDIQRVVAPTARDSVKNGYSLGIVRGKRCRWSMAILPRRVRTQRVLHNCTL